MSLLLLIFLGTLALDVRSVMVENVIYPLKTIVTPTDLNCEYTIRESSLDGPKIQSALNGARYFHRWDCDESENYAILVKSCYLISRDSLSLLFVDDKGCFNSFLNDSEIFYSPSSNSAHVVFEETFGFYGEPGITFDCKIQVCNKTSDECNGVTPPRCDPNAKLFRAYFEPEVVFYHRTTETTDHTKKTSTILAETTTSLPEPVITSTVQREETPENLKCEYTIREGSLDGPLAREAVVGMPLFHRWECDGDSSYGLLVRSCFIIGTLSGKSVQFIDDKGCPSSYDFPSIIYFTTLHAAYAVIETISVNDDESITFECDFAYCNKTSDECRGVTPPHCHRNFDHLRKNFDHMVVADKIIETYESSLEDNIAQETTTESSELSNIDDKLSILLDKVEKQERRLHDVTIFFVLIIVVIFLEALFYLMVHLAKKYTLGKWMTKKTKDTIKPIDV